MKSQKGITDCDIGEFQIRVLSVRKLYKSVCETLMYTA